MGEEKLIQLNDHFVFDDMGIGWELFESSGKDSLVDGVHILAKLKGPFFVIDGKSDNKRYYSRDLWENAIKKSKDKIEKGLMFGTIGHDLEIDDKALREGLVSHRITKLWIDEDKKVGMGEALVYNTPAGQRLNTYYRSGSGLGTSSRAFGKYSGKTEDGEAQVVDPDTFGLETFDIVTRGGVSIALPKVIEDLGGTPYEINTDKEEKDMEENKMGAEKSNEKEYQMLESLSKEKTKIQEELDKALDSNEDLKGQVAVKDSKINELNDAVADLKKRLGEFEEMGTVAEISKVMDLAQGTSKRLTQVKEELEDAKKDIKAYKELGTPEEIEKAFDKFEDISDRMKELGQPDEVEDVLDRVDELLSQIEEIGSLDEITKVVDLAEQYVEFGSPEEIQKAFDLTNKLVEGIKEKDLERDAEDIADQFEVSKEVATRMLKSMTKDEVAETLTEVKRGQVNYSIGERFRVTEDNKGSEVDEGDESFTKRHLGEGSRVTRLWDSK